MDRSGLWSKPLDPFSKGGLQMCRITKYTSDTDIHLSLYESICCSNMSFIPVLSDRVQGLSNNV